jgi:hypothetical protein
LKEKADRMEAGLLVLLGATVARGLLPAHSRWSTSETGRPYPAS